MSMRIYSLALVVALSGCGGGSPATPAGNAVDCALDGSAVFAKNCTVERVDGGLILRRPDGGFRRIKVESDDVTALDGADPITVTPMSNGYVEIAIAGDRFRTRRATPVDDSKP